MRMTIRIENDKALFRVISPTHAWAGTEEMDWFLEEHKDGIYAVWHDSRDWTTDRIGVADTWEEALKKLEGLVLGKDFVIFVD